MRRIVPGGRCWRSSHQDNLGAAILRDGASCSAAGSEMDRFMVAIRNSWVFASTSAALVGTVSIDPAHPPPLSLIKIVYQSPSAIFETCDSNQIMKWAGCFQVLQSLLVDGEGRDGPGLGRLEYRKKEVHTSTCLSVLDRDVGALVLVALSAPALPSFIFLSSAKRNPSITKFPVLLRNLEDDEYGRICMN